MKKLIITLIVVLLSMGTLVAVVLAAVYGDIIVAGAGTVAVNGTYTESGILYNGKTQWVGPPSGPSEEYRILWATGAKFGDPDGWSLVEYQTGNIYGVYYYNTQDTDQPPQTGWVTGSSGTEPPPTLSGDGSLPVILSSFYACACDRGIELVWVVESETDHVGYVLDRRIDGQAWQTIASYLTHAELRGQGNRSEQTTYSVIDEKVQAGQSYTYRLSDLDGQGILTTRDMISFTLEAPPEQTALKPAYPNPFNPSTKIQYELAEEANVTLSVVDVLGRHVQTIVPGETKAAGVYSIHWNGCTEDGINAPSGVYFLVMRAGDAVETQKVMLVR